MSSPTPPSSRGRGRGRGKELTPNERVTHWVNQREARRLNKERWANRTPDTNSPVGDKENENESPMPVKQEIADSDTGSERSKGKRQVQLYVPPSLRAKKASSPGATPDNATSSRDASPPMKDTLASVSPHSDIASQKCEVTESTVSTSIKDSTKGVGESGDGTTPATGRPKGRGRGRKKPEVEIYVPRALRAAKQDSRSSAKADKDDENKPEVSDSDKRLNDSGCDNNNSEINDIPKQQASAKLDGIPDPMLVGDPLPLDEQCHSQDVNLDISESCTLSTGNYTAKKMKHETAEVETLQHAPEATRPEVTETTDDQSRPDSAADPFTFEFYDPAVIAFMPSPQIAQDTCDQSNSSSYFNYSGSSSYEHGTYSSTADMNDNCQSVLTPSQSQNTAGFQYQPQTCTGDVANCGFKNTTRRDSDLNVQAIELDVIKNEEDLSSLRPSEDSFLPLTQDSVEDQNCHTCTVPASQNRNISEASCKELDTKLNATDSDEHKDLPHEHNMPPSKEISEGTQCDNVSCQTQQDKVPFNTEETQQLKTEQRCEEGSKKQSDGKCCEGAGGDDEDSWDAMFDDNGDCLDETLMNELTEYVGKVEIDRPKINYLNYEPKEPDLDLQAFSHIVEIYDFSPELATCDLIAAFREFSSRGFDVKWVDDTHALGIFSSSVAANEALKMIHPLLKVRPMSQASKKGQSKARHCQEFLQPYKARPETTSIAARRLVAGALGMAPRVSREVREQERKKLKEAKEKRRQERQQKIDMWDGSIGKCAMDEEETGSR